jgi:hypothetical protein
MASYYQGVGDGSSAGSDVAEVNSGEQENSGDVIAEVNSGEQENSGDVLDASSWAWTEADGWQDENGAQSQWGSGNGSGWWNNDQWSRSTWRSNATPHEDRPMREIAKVPSYDGSAPLRLWLRKLKVCQMNTATPKIKQAGKLLEELTGKAWRAMDTFTSFASLEAADGVQRLVSHRSNR